MQQLNIFGSQYDVYDTSCCSNSNKRTLYIEVNVEFRTVNVELERNNEIKHKFIRNFVYHTNQHLYGGLRSDSIKIK